MAHNERNKDKIKGAKKQSAQLLISKVPNFFAVLLQPAENGQKKRPLERVAQV